MEFEVPAGGRDTNTVHVRYNQQKRDLFHSDCEKADSHAVKRGVFALSP